MSNLSTQARAPRESAATSLVGPSTTVSAIASTPLDRAWDRFVPIDLAAVFPARKGPIPRVVGTTDQTGRWDEPGSARTVLLGDGSRVREEITSSAPSHGAAAPTGPGATARFGYTVSGFTGPLGRLASEARGSWTFCEEDGVTRIEWTYAFAPRTALARPILALLVSTFWRAYMREGLRNTVRILEAQT